MRPVRLERSRLCAACTHACSLSITGCRPGTCQIHKLTDVSGWAKWSKTKRDFMAETSTSGCHLCIIIAHAFDEASVATFSKMDMTESLHLCFSYRTVERDPSGSLDWGQRTRMTINDIALENHLPDEFWLQIRPDLDSTFDELVIDLRIRPLQGITIIRYAGTLSNESFRNRHCLHTHDRAGATCLDNEQSEPTTSIKMDQEMCSVTSYVQSLSTAEARMATQETCVCWLKVATTKTHCLV
jgi:hypothetical protein